MPEEPFVESVDVTTKLFFAASPLRGSGIKIERLKGDLRKVEL